MQGFFAEDLGMLAVFIWNGWFCFGGGNGPDGYLTNIILVMMDRSGNVSGSGEEASLFGVA